MLGMMLTPRDENQTWALIDDFGKIGTRIVPPRKDKTMLLFEFEN